MSSGLGLGMSNYSNTQAAIKTERLHPQIRRKAALAVCLHADSHEEATELLAMLGLLEDPDVE